jgi:hypothetical protein
MHPELVNTKNTQYVINIGNCFLLNNKYKNITLADITYKKITYKNITKI